MKMLSFKDIFSGSFECKKRNGKCAKAMKASLMVSPFSEPFRSHFGHESQAFVKMIRFL